jgi:Zn-dependent M28 family amino/carboxypeptidase
LPGSGDGIIVVGAHFDHVDEGDGVVDNWSGASLLPSLYESLSSKPRNHTFVFISFTDEEKGLVGSRAYAAGLGEEDVARIRCMVNLDTLGLGPTKVWVHDSDPLLVKEFFSAASEMGLPAGEMNVDGIGYSDGQSFKLRKIPTITLHSTTKDAFKLLHSDRDTIAAVKFGDYYGSYRLIAGYLSLLDSRLSRR